MVELMRMRVTYSGGSLVGTCVSTLHYTPTGSDAADAAAGQSKSAALFAAIKSTFAPGIVTFLGQADFIDQATGDLLRSVNIANVTDGGSASGEPLPPANQVNLRMETGVILNGKRLRGHWYLPLAAEASSNGNLTGSIFANLATAKAAWLAGAVRPVVYHRPVGPHGSTRPGTSAVVSDVVAQPKFAVLRSRRD